MSIKLNTRHIYLATLLAIFTNSHAHAGFFDNIVNNAKKTAENVVDKVVDKKADDVAETVMANEPKPESQAKHVKPSASIKKSIPSSVSGGVDIVGLTVGMTPDQVEQVLQQYNNDLKVRRHMHSDNKRKKHRMPGHEYVEYIVGITPNEREIIHITFSEPPTDNISQAVVRRMSFDQPVLIENLVRNLKSKYGQNPHEKTRKGKTLLWRLGGGNAPDSICAATTSGMVIQAIQKGSTYSPILGSTIPGCGPVMFANAVGHDGVANSMSMFLGDESIIQKRKLETDAYIAKLKKAEKEKKRQAAANNSAPRL